MTDIARLEERLNGAFAVAPDSGFDALDRRIAALVASPPAAAHRRIRRSLPFGRRVRLVLAVGATLLVGTGAAVGAMRLLDRVATNTTGGMAVAWERGVALDQRQVHGDYSVTLARAYSDVGQVILGVSVERLAGAGPIPGLQAELRDPAGAVLRPGNQSIGSAEELQVAELLTFAPAAGGGEFTLSLGLEADGVEPSGPLPLTFRFTLPAPIGAMVAVDRAVAIENGTVRLGDVRLSPTQITATVHVEASGPDGTGWTAIGRFEHGDAAYDIAWGKTPDDNAPGDFLVGTVDGSDDAIGSWTLVVTELVGERPDGSQVRPQGPWRIPFTVP